MKFLKDTSSGKLTKEELKMWFEDVYFPSVGQQSVLLVDSWTSYKDQDMINSVKPMDKNVEILTIPPNTTSLVQPLDKYGFRLWKNFVRKFSDRILLDGID